MLRGRVVVPRVGLQATGTTILRAQPSMAAAPPPQPKPPQCRALLTLQSQVAGGGFAERHLRGIVVDGEKDDLQKFEKLLQCTREAQVSMAQNPQRPRATQMRNLVCVCHSVCPTETEAWVGCFRHVQRLRKQAAQAQQQPQQQGISAGAASRSDARSTSTNCEALKKQLERCTEYASTRLLHAALLPKDREPGDISRWQRDLS